MTSFLILPVQLSDIIDAVEMTYGDLEYFLDKKTGEIISSKGLILVGEKKAVYIAIKNNKIVERNTRLSERLRKS